MVTRVRAVLPIVLAAMAVAAVALLGVSVASTGSARAQPTAPPTS